MDSQTIYIYVYMYVQAVRIELVKVPVPEAHADEPSIPWQRLERLEKFDTGSCCPSELNRKDGSVHQYMGLSENVGLIFPMK